MWYVAQDNYAGGCAVFDNKEDCKHFIKTWKKEDEEWDSEHFTIYIVSQINPSYYEYMDNYAVPLNII